MPKDITNRASIQITETFLNVPQFSEDDLNLMRYKKWFDFIKDKYVFFWGIFRN